MKSKILSIITLFLMIGLVSKSFANNNSTVLKETAPVNKIEVRGNVEVYISDATTDQIKVYNKYYAENALVQSKNGVLRIASYTPEKLVVWVSSSDLRAVSAYDNAVVKSFGNLSKIEFTVDLHNRAQADLNLNTFTATLTVRDNAKANLKGSATEMVLNRDIQSSINSTAFVANRVYDVRPSFASINDARVTDM